VGKGYKKKHRHVFFQKHPKHARDKEPGMRVPGGLEGGIVEARPQVIDDAEQGAHLVVSEPELLQPQEEQRAKGSAGRERVHTDHAGDSSQEVFFLAALMIDCDSMGAALVILPRPVGFVLVLQACDRDLLVLLQLEERDVLE
jgi:hypothetical protein